MFSLNEKFTDEEGEILRQAKGHQTWHNFILDICKEKLKEEDVLDG